MKIAIIPARGGSKRIPRKNVRLFCGRPIIAYSIDAAIKSQLFDRIIVSTDDHEIADVAREHGAESPFMRPAELADDYIGTLPVVRHAIEEFRSKKICPEYVCCIYATAPFVTPLDLQRGWQTLIESGADYAFTVTSFVYPIQRAIRITATGRLEMFHPENYEARSQDLEEAYHDAGQFYWGRSQAFLEESPLFTEHAAPVLLRRYQVQDIDTVEDWNFAELMFKAWHMKKDKLS